VLYGTYRGALRSLARPCGDIASGPAPVPELSGAGRRFAPRTPPAVHARACGPLSGPQEQRVGLSARGGLPPRHPAHRQAGRAARGGARAAQRPRTNGAHSPRGLPRPDDKAVWSRKQLHTAHSRSKAAHERGTHRRAARCGDQRARSPRDESSTGPLRLRGARSAARLLLPRGSGALRAPFRRSSVASEPGAARR